MDQKEYTAPEMEIVKFDTEDVITASREDDETSLVGP